MEVNFGLYVPEIVSDEAFKFSEEFVSWGGETFSQSPRKFSWKGVTVAEKDMPPYFHNYIPENIKRDGWTYLSFDENSFDEWEKAVNCLGSENMQEATLKVFLHEFLQRLNSWVVIFELNCDQLDNVYELNHDELLAKIDSVLNWNAVPEGFVAFKLG